MGKYLSWEEIFALNPHIDKKEVEKYGEMLRKLHDAQTKGAKYNLALPFAHRHKFVDEDTGIDPRTVNLGHSR